MQRAYIMIKPDGVQRGLVGEIIQRLEQKGFQLIAAKLTILTKEQAEIHYVEHKEKSFYDELVAFITSSPICAMVWKGDQVVTLSRTLIGKTNVNEALPGTIRGDFALHTGMNLIHGSDSAESAEREIRNIFRPEELLDYHRPIQAWI
jgi:nucleoside-diphosphate kinase